MFVIENKLSLSDRRGKLMHYPESPKVSACELLRCACMQNEAFALLGKSWKIKIETVCMLSAIIDILKSEQDNLSILN